MHSATSLDCDDFDDCDDDVQDVEDRDDCYDRRDRYDSSAIVMIATIVLDDLDKHEDIDSNY